MSSSPVLMPHAVCWRADRRLIWVMVVTNAITFLSYLSLCCTLLYLARRTRAVIARDWAWFVVGFALFIAACGSTHLMEVVTTWVPWFWLDAAANVVTALLSAYVAVQLIRRAGSVAFSVNDYAARLADTENEKLQMRDSLMAAQKLEDWSRTSAVLAHEIANPLEAIQNLLYLIRCGEGVSSEVIKLAQTAGDEAHRVLTMSRSTLSFFRQGTVAELVDLRAAADSVCLLLETVMRQRNIVLHIKATGDVHVEALPGEARQALLNLVRNAYEATSRPGADVYVMLTGKPDMVEIVVRDQGSGIDAALMPQLFQFGMSTKGQQGNGMGLWAVRSILAKHGGDIEAASTLGEGTTLRCSGRGNLEEQQAGSRKQEAGSALMLDKQLLSGMTTRKAKAMRRSPSPPPPDLYFLFLSLVPIPISYFLCPIPYFLFPTSYFLLYCTPPSRETNLRKPSARAAELAAVASGASPARMKPWPAPS